MPLRCIVVDDEPLALKLLETYVERTPGLELAASFTSPAEARAAINHRVADLAFLDIQMPGTNGLQLARLAEQQGIKVVFTTAYRDYAIEGFRVNALDYLLKPISYSDFLESANRAAAAIPPAAPRQPEYMTVRHNYRTMRIAFDDIIYIEGLRDYVKFHLRGHDRPAIIQMSLKEAENSLPPESFVRIHRSYIVSTAFVSSFSRSAVTLSLPDDGASLTLPLSDTRRSHFSEIIAES